MIATATARQWVRPGSLSLLSLFVLCGGAACSGESKGGAASTALSRESPAAASNAAGAAGATANSGGEAPPTGAGTSNEGNRVPEGLVNAGGGAARGTGSPATSEGTSVAADAGLALDAPAAACARELTVANKAVVSAAIDELFGRGDITAVDRYWGEPYLQHNPIAASGVGAFRDLFSGLISPGNSIYQLSRVIGECELVLIHGDYTSFGGPTFDMFRVQEGRVVEHWDAFAASAGPNPSGHTALDGPSVVEDAALSGQNEALVLAFAERVLIEGARERILDFMSPDLIEHDPESLDGSAAYVQNLQDRALTYRQVRHRIGDGNFVFLLSEGTLGTTEVAHYDLFRVAGSLIVEHWNGSRDVPASSQSGLGIF